MKVRNRLRKEAMDPNKLKEGVSVKEIESFAKKHRFEVFFCLSFVLACFFSFVFFAAWSLVLAAIGAIVGVALASSVEKMMKNMLGFVLKQEKTTQLVLAAVGLVISIFLPPVIFLLVGLSGGKNLIMSANSADMQKP